MDLICRTVVHNGSFILLLIKLNCLYNEKHLQGESPRVVGFPGLLTFNHVGAFGKEGSLNLIYRLFIDFHSFS